MNKEDRSFEALLQFLQQERGLDFTGYKRPSLMRRVSRRMQLIGVDGFERYADYLEANPDEFAQLLNSILINITGFFRDPESWDCVAKKAVAPLIAAKGPQDTIRAWSAGCASGQEAYSIAMMLADALGVAAFHERVKIYASDADEEALAQGRLGSYTEKDLAELDPKLTEKYFERSNGRYVFHKELRRAVIFGHHDLVQDAPISRLDLLVCRNTLMYFNAETQAKVLSRFHFALNPGGYLFLGRAEMLLAHASQFAPVDLTCRLFAKIADRAAPRARLPAPGAAEANAVPVMRETRLRELSLEESPVPRIIFDANGTLAMANQRARALFSISPLDFGRPLQDLEIAYRPAELRPVLEHAYAERRTMTLTSVERRFPSGETQYFDVVVAPLLDPGQAPLGAAVTFVDVTRYVRLSEELARLREETQTANEELQSANEELETTNEELQSSNEELETTNEELQSTNEELETMNEELQSTNEELQTVNEELRERTGEANRLNAFLESVLRGIRSAAVVVNPQLEILVWNRRAEDLWGLRFAEVQGKSLLGLDIGLPVAELRAALRSCLSGETEQADLVLDAINRRGKSIKCHVIVSPLLSIEKKGEGAILLMDEAA